MREKQTYSVSENKLTQFLDRIGSYELPDVSVGNNMLENNIKLFFFTDGNRELFGSLFGESFIVNRDKPERVTADAVIVSRDDTIGKKSWFIPSEDVDQFDIIPELRMAYHEAEHFYEREANLKYHFDNGETMVALPSPSPIPRLDSPVTFTRKKFLGGAFPKKWLLQTDDGDMYYLRERSGTIKLYDGPDIHNNIIFHAFVGKEHPGTTLRKHEVINFVTSVDYLNIVDSPDLIPIDVVNEHR